MASLDENHHYVMRMNGDELETLLSALGCIAAMGNPTDELSEACEGLLGDLVE